MATSDEKLWLQWNSLGENTSLAFGDLRQDKEFTDVTLACEDRQQVEALSDKNIWNAFTFF